MAAILLTADLACSSRATAAAASQGATCETAMSIERLRERVAAEPFRLVLIDLNMPGLDCAVLVPQLRATAASNPSIVTFGPHVHEAKLAAARTAGCDAVMARGQFYAQIDELLKQA